MSRDPASRIEDLLTRAEITISRTYLDAINQVRDQATLKDISDLLEAGNIDGALNIINVIAATASAVALSSVEAGVSTASVVSEATNQVVSFDQTNARMVSFLQQERLRLVNEFTQQQRAATLEALSEGVSQGNNPRAQAVVFRNSIGLTARQLRTIDNYRLALEARSSRALDRELRDRRFDRTVQRAIRNNIAIEPAKIDRMVERYRERMLASRAETIARTESLRAVHYGVSEMYQQAVDNGVLEENKIVRKWVTARDSRVRDHHGSMNGQTRGFNEPFLSGNGNLLIRPGDPNAPASETINCRCAITTRLT